MLQRGTQVRSAVSIPAQFATERTLIGPDYFASHLGTTIVFGVPDNAWAPIFSKGEFVVVHLDRRDLAEDCFILRRSSSGGNFNIVRPRLHRKEQGRIVGAPSEPTWETDLMMASGGHVKGQYWWIQFGQRPIYSLGGQPTEYVMSADGPMPDKLLREECVGRIIGIAGERQ